MTRLNETDMMLSREQLYGCSELLGRPQKHHACGAHDSKITHVKSCKYFDETVMKFDKLHFPRLSVK